MQCLHTNMSVWSYKGEKMMETIVISGVGGQGILTMAKIIGYALVKKGLRVRVAEVHGMAQRGGSVITYIRYGDVDCPRPSHGMAKALISLELLECTRYLYLLKRGGIVISNDWIYPPNVPGVSVPSKEEIVKLIEENTGKLYLIPANKIADSLGPRLIANTVILGSVAKLGILPLSKEELLESLKKNIKHKYLEVNFRAFDEGYKAV